MRPLILLSNDDGVAAEGLLALRAALSEFAEVVVCAPSVNQSASSHSLTLHSPLRVTAMESGVFAVDGTPADCVYIALHGGGVVLERTPDLVVSGMNHGPNLGRDVIYSGTVAAAREGAHRGLLAIAISASTEADTPAAARMGARVVRALWTTHASQTDASQTDANASTKTRGALLNINIPPGSSWPLRTTRLGHRNYEDGVIPRKDPRGRDYYWIGGSNVRHEQDENTDTGAWDAGAASVTPLTLDLNAPHHAELAATVVRHATNSSD